MIPEINIQDYNYNLPDERIAKYPLAERDLSKLLIYSNDGVINTDTFNQITAHLPADHLMVFNDTKVVPARLHFQRDTGAHIEIFCLEPVLPEEYVSMFAVTDRCRWKCIVGNVKRWKGDVLNLYNPEENASVASMGLKASLVERNGETSIVEFFWDDGAPFSAVLERCGQIPIPPYLNRGTEDIDLERYQTLYARFRGSVAAPTAGLHFTEAVLGRLEDKNIRIGNVCLHVGAGTFKPVKSAEIGDHEMHSEYIVVERKTIEKLIAHGGEAIAVGTTSVRTLESLYYIGVLISQYPDATEEQLRVTQWMPYDEQYNRLTTLEALQQILDYLDRHHLPALHTNTQIMIAPGYTFHIVKRIVTNFHQPKSTLLLLVSAFVKGNWRKIYDYALGHDFRFLSYGDSSLLVP